ncbi:MAG: LVIVD repeat-containing protein [Stenotrophobium sp.]
MRRFHVLRCLSLAVCNVGLAALFAGLAACGNSSAPTSTSALAPADDLPETGLQGEVPLADQLSGRAALGYRKGLRLVGQNNIMSRGANFDLAWLDDCAYVTTTSPQSLFGPGSTPYLDPQYNPLNGMAVIDASDPTNPKLVSILQSPAMLAPHESLHANQARHIIVGVRAGGTIIDVYEAQDCRHPILRSSFNFAPSITLPSLPTIPGFGSSLNTGTAFVGHAMCMTDDGRTAYATSSAQSNAVIDLDDLAHPKLIQLFAPAAHDCGTSPDGNRLYLAIFGFESLGLGIPNGPSVGQNGMMIVDSSAIQNRTAATAPLLLGLAPPMIGFVGWSNVADGEAPSAGSHTARWFRNHGRTYLYSSDEWPTAGVCPWSHSRIIDITDETHPVVVSNIQLEVDQLANCLTTIPDNANYSAHYVGIDNVNEATTLFTSNYSAGLRVWDIHDPTHPKEIAYWHPVPNPNTPTVPFSAEFGSSGSNWDAVPTYVRYRPETGQIWIASYSAGFQILQFTQSAGPTAPRPTGVP